MHRAATVPCPPGTSTAILDCSRAIVCAESVLDVVVGSICTDSGELKELTHTFSGPEMSLQTVSLRTVVASEEE